MRDHVACPGFQYSDVDLNLHTVEVDDVRGIMPHFFPDITGPGAFIDYSTGGFLA